MGRIEGLETKLQTNNEAMLCLQATSIEILQQLKDIRGMVEAKDSKFKSIPLSENNRDQVLDTYSDCQQRYDRHGVPFHDRKDPPSTLYIQALQAGHSSQGTSEPITPGLTQTSARWLYKAPHSPGSSSLTTWLRLNHISTCNYVFNKMYWFCLKKTVSSPPTTAEFTDK